MNHDDPLYQMPADENRWYCLWSRTLRQIVLDDDVTTDGVFQFCGNVPVFMDAVDAERHAVVKRWQYPLHTIEVRPLPDAPPTVPVAPDDESSLAAIQFPVAGINDAGVPVPLGIVEVRLDRDATPSAAVAAVELADLFRVFLGKHSKLVVAGELRRIHLGLRRPTNPLTLAQEAL